jgi:hypothetical protein
LRSAAWGCPANNETEEIAIIAAKKQRVRRIAVSSASNQVAVYLIGQACPALFPQQESRINSIISAYELTDNQVEAFEAWPQSFRRQPTQLHDGHCPLIPLRSRSSAGKPLK